MDTKELKEILTKHKLWLENKDGGQRADLCGAILRGAILRDANLCGAELRDANLCDADLRDANLRGAILRGAILRDANLRDADLRDADLRGADLRGANLRYTILRDADLRDADLSDARLPHFQIPPSEGSFICWKKTTKGVVKLRVPSDAKRTSSLIGCKCRASKVEVLEGPSGGTGPIYGLITYNVGETVESTYDDDIRVECTQGIHFFMTKQEAEEW